MSEYKPYLVELGDITLFNYKKTRVDIKEVTLEINVYHDIYSSGIECEIAILDAIGMIEMLPIVGDETLLISFKTQSFDDMRFYAFRIYSVTKRQLGNETSEVYILKGCSQEIINDARTSVNKSYVDVSGDNIIREIYDSYLKPTEESHYVVKKKNLFLQETGETHTKIFSGQKPIDAINYICNESGAKQKGSINKYTYDKYNKPPVESVGYEDGSAASNYVFYESYDGWYLHTMDYLLTKDKVEDFYLMEASLEDQQKKDIKLYQIISNVSIERQLDTLDNLNEGLFSHKVETIDPILKRFTTSVFTYENGSKSINHLEKDKRLFSKDSVFKSDGNTSQTYYLVSNIGNQREIPYVYNNVFKPHQIDPYPETDAQIRNKRTKHQFLNYEIASRIQLNNMVLNVTIPGNRDIEIGNVINVHLPQKALAEEFRTKENLLFGKEKSAKFFVTSLRHVINRNEDSFFTSLECVKDVYAKDIIEEDTQEIPDEL